MRTGNRLVAVAAGLVFFVGCVEAAPPPSRRAAPAAAQLVCLSAQADVASDLVDHLDSWRSVAAYFKSYRQCDEGSIAEGSSEAVARLLVDHWNTLPKLQQQIESDSALRSFVVAHINSTLDTDDLQKIAEYAATSCPAGLVSLCGALGDAAKGALQGP